MSKEDEIAGYEKINGCESSSDDDYVETTCDIGEDGLNGLTKVIISMEEQEEVKKNHMSGMADSSSKFVGGYSINKDADSKTSTKRELLESTSKLQMDERSANLASDGPTYNLNMTQDFKRVQSSSDAIRNVIAYLFSEGEEGFYDIKVDVDMEIPCNDIMK